MLLKFIEENGLYITSIAIYRHFFRKLQSLALSSKINAGQGFLVGNNSYIRGCKYLSIGHHFSAGVYLRLEAIAEHQGNTFSPQINIGDYVSVGDFVHISAVELVTIQDNVLMGSKVHITDHAHGSYKNTGNSDPATPPRFRKVTSNGPVKICSNVWIGEMVNILPGVTIGKGSIIGAGSVVTQDIPDETIAVGIPAKPIKRYDKNTEIWELINAPKT